MGIGVVFKWIIAKSVLRPGGAQSKEACGSANICDDLKASIDGEINMVLEMEEISRDYTGEENRGVCIQEDEGPGEEER